MFLLYLDVGDCFSTDDDYESCPHARCVANLVHKIDEVDSVNRHCVEDDDQHALGVYSTFIFKRKSFDVKHTVSLYCEYNLCNGKNFTDIFFPGFFNIYNNLMKIMYTIIEDEKQMLTTISTNLSNTSDLSQTNTTIVQSTTVPNIGLYVRLDPKAMCIALMIFIFCLIFLA